MRSASVGIGDGRERRCGRTSLIRDRGLSILRVEVLTVASWHRSILGHF